MQKTKYLIALPSLKGTKGFNCPTIVISGINEADAIAAVRHIMGNVNIGDIKPVDY